MERPTATRSNNIQWSGMCIKTPLDSDVNENDLEVLIAFNGSNTQGHYVPICKSYTYFYTCFTLIYVVQSYIHTVHLCTLLTGLLGGPGIPANRLIIHIYCNNFTIYIYGTQVQKR